MKTKINKIFKPLYTTKKRYILLTGGRASLKSSTIHDFIVRLTYEHGHGVLFTRYTMTSAEKSIIPEFNLCIKRLGIQSDFKITKTAIQNLRTGSFIIFSGIKTSSGDQTANLKSISGITTWVIEEGEDFTDEKTFDTIDDSIRTSSIQNRVIWVQNPSTKEHFIYKRWIEDSNKKIKVDKHNVTVSNHEQVEHIHSWYKIAEDLGYLDSDWLYKANKLKETNPKWYYHNYVGGWLEKAEGVIYEDWQEGEFDESLSYVYGLDFGSNDPDALTKVAVDEKRKLIYLKECYFKNNTSFEGLAKVLENRVGYIDRIVGDSAERRMIIDLYNKGFNIVKARKGKGSVDMGIKMIQSYTLIVDPESKNLKKALNNYKWHDKKAGFPDHEWSDLCDSFRYAVTDILNYKVGMIT